MAFNKTTREKPAIPSKVSRIFVLVAGILGIVGAFWTLVYLFFIYRFAPSMISSLDILATQGDAAVMPFIAFSQWFQILFMVTGVVGIISGIMLIIAYRQMAKPDEAHKWSMVALIFSIIPPNLFGLIGSIMALAGHKDVPQHHEAAFQHPKSKHVTASGVPVSNSAATASMVLGIIGIVFSFLWFFGFFGIILDILAIIFGIVGINKAKKDPAAEGRGKAIAGLVMGLAGILILILFVVVIFGLVGSSLASVKGLTGNVVRMLA